MRPAMNDAASPDLCLVVSYTGHVQGVGFRWTTSRIARRHDVVGYVRNEMDGSVTLVAQGQRSVVEAFLKEVAEAMSARIKQVESTDATTRDDLAGFQIRR